MNYEEFESKVEEITGRDKDISVSWRIGGQTGGTCWDESKHYPVDAEPEPEFDDLDKVLEAVCPTLSFLQYKRICSECVRTEETSSHEYYGNYANYMVKKIGIRDLYEALKAGNLV